MKYCELKEKMKNFLSAPNSTEGSSQRQANLLSALTGWLKWQGKSDDSKVGPEMSTTFDLSLNSFCHHLTENGATPTAIRDKRSMLRRWHAFSAQTRLTLQGRGETPFQMALTSAISTAAITVPALAEKSLVSESVLRQWLRGATPNVRSGPSLSRLESVLNLKRTTLAKLAMVDTPFTVTRQGTSSPIAYRKKLAERLSNKYYLKRIPEGLRKEWVAFLDHKTTLLPLLNRQERGIWRIRPIKDVSKDYLNWYCMPNPGGFVPTAAKTWTFVSSYLGYVENVLNKISRLVAENIEGQPSTTKPEIKAASLAQFADVNMLTGYLEFLKDRAGAHTGAAVSAVQFALSLVHPETGYLTQSPQFGDTLGITKSNWKQYCNEQFEKLKKLRSTLNKHSQISRKPFEPISALIDLDFPLGGYLEGIERLQQYASRQPRGSRIWATAVRDAALLSVLAMHPLRAQNLSMMRFGQGEHLTQDRNGVWGLKFRPEELKNPNGAAKDSPFDVALPEWVGALVSEWLFDARAVLEGKESRTNFVFISENEVAQGIAWGGLRRAVERRTKRFIPSTPGFGPHGVRHLVATSWLKTHPHDYPSVALLLHDKLATVMKHYGHVQMSHTHRAHAEEVERMYEARLSCKASIQQNWQHP